MDTATIAKPGLEEATKLLARWQYAGARLTDRHYDTAAFCCSVSRAELDRFLRRLTGGLS